MKKPSPPTTELRRRAEQRLLEHPPEAMPAPESHEVRRLVHDLEVHQVELQLQNEELTVARGELEQSLASFTQLFTFAPIGYLTLAADGNIREANLAAAKLLGPPRASLLGRSLARFLAPEHLSDFHRFLTNATQIDTATASELELAHVGEARRWVRLNANSLIRSTPGAAVERTLLVALEDITERRLYEQQLQETQEQLRAALRVRDDLMAVVSHDLLSPLSTIKLSADLMVRVVPEQQERRKNRRQVDAILRAADGMKRLIDDLLQAAAIETGTFSVYPKPEQLGAIVSDALELFEPIVTAKSIRLVREFDADLPDVRCDRQRVIQVLSNLLGNAIKFAPPNGTIVLSVHRHDDDLVVSVADNGPGIPAEQAKHLFDRYWRGSSAGGLGFGLGLYIAKGIVEAHGQRIWVESQTGHGSTFRFTMPQASATTAHPSA